MCRNGYESVQAAQSRILQCNGYDVHLQFNPQRIVSTGAKVDSKSISERKCFLCVENLPIEQQGVLYENEYLILCNPMPIFPVHYTISNVDHIPQTIGTNIDVMLRLARDMNPDFTVFYNGPRCGASAPDHMHFQTAIAGKIPIEDIALDGKRRKYIRQKNGVAVYMLKNLDRCVVMLEGKSDEILEEIVVDLLARLREVEHLDEEPKVNIICRFDDAQWRVIVFPRSKHRPDAFFKEGNERVVISPAAVDMGGLVITPMEKDFKKVDVAFIERMYREVSLDEAVVESLL
jgi:ATP adenylyltransferase/5',5'''-P-1,P-4-tetraphosphate phosphorylase II